MSDDQFTFDGFIPTEEERQEARKILKTGLEAYLGIGPAKAVTTKKLAQRLFKNERAVTLAVYDARRAGLPICSGQDGFFLPRDENDCIVCYAGMQGRASEITDSANAILAGWYAGWRPPAEGARN